MYANGWGVTQSDSEALKWYTVAAKYDLSGNSQFHISQMYSRGKGVPKNQIEAFKWMKLAAELEQRDKESFGKSQSALSDMYRLGQGVEINRAEAIKWKKSGAVKYLDNGGKQAYLEARQLASLYYAEKKYKEAYKWHFLSIDPREFGPKVRSSLNAMYIKHISESEMHQISTIAIMCLDPYRDCDI